MFASCLGRSHTSTFSLSPSHKDGAGVADFLQQDFVDVWQFRADGMVDVRVAKDRYEALVPAPRCAVLIKDVEEFVQRTENVTTIPAAEWFEEYVSVAKL